MFSALEAALIIEDNLDLMPVETVPFKEASWRVLRQQIVADRHVPPFNRVMMDGIAFSSRTWNKGVREFRIAGVQAAGSPASTLEDTEACFEVMTGAVLPDGCDCVAPFEEIETSDGVARIVADFEAKPGRFVHQAGSDYSQGAVLVEPGCRLTSRQIAVAASCGCTELTVACIPRIALVSSGDELVDLGEPIAPHQIRKSNVYALQTALVGIGFPAVEMHHLKDDKDEIEKALADILERCDVVILSGGVSKGKFDYIPGALDALGVEKLFQWVRQRPGRPFWFGRKGSTTVFALPGNPLSTLVCYHRYVIPALHTMMGMPPPEPKWSLFGEYFEFEPPLTFFLPVRNETRKDGMSIVFPVPAANSGDYASIVATDGFVELPGEDLSEFPPGFAARFYPWF